MPVFRNILFSIIVISLILTGMEYAADAYLKKKPSYVQTFIRLNAQPLLEFAPETKAAPPYHFRRNAYSAKNVA